MSKQDCVTLCNEFKIPIGDFEMQHCSRCFQHECTRSQHGKSQFEHRVDTWEERLFLNVPRRDESDPLVQTLQAKKFVEVDPGPSPEVGRSAWVDPRDLSDEAPRLDPPKPAPKTSGGPPPALSAVSPFLNTPDRPGQMVGQEKPQKLAAVDQWAPKEPEKNRDQVVKPGVRIRFGKTGV
jgi:hypothetical protein